MGRWLEGCWGDCWSSGGIALAAEGPSTRRCTIPSAAGRACPGCRSPDPSSQVPAVAFHQLILCFIALKLYHCALNSLVLGVSLTDPNVAEQTWPRVAQFCAADSCENEL